MKDTRKKNGHRSGPAESHVETREDGPDKSSATEATEPPATHVYDVGAALQNEANGATAPATDSNGTGAANGAPTGSAPAVTDEQKAEARTGLERALATLDTARGAVSQAEKDVSAALKLVAERLGRGPFTVRGKRITIVEKEGGVWAMRQHVERAVQELF